MLQLNRLTYFQLDFFFFFLTTQSNRFLRLGTLKSCVLFRHLDSSIELKKNASQQASLKSREKFKWRPKPNTRLACRTLRSTWICHVEWRIKKGKRVSAKSVFPSAIRKERPRAANAELQRN